MGGDLKKQYKCLKAKLYSKSQLLFFNNMFCPLTWIEFLGWSKITQLKKVGAGIYQQVLWLNISVTNTERMNICQRSEHLIRIQFNQNIRNSLFSLSVISHNLVEGFRNEIHNNIIGIIGIDKIFFFVLIKLIQCIPHKKLEMREP